jgi:hypothetical protein
MQLCNYVIVGRVIFYAVRVIPKQITFSQDILFCLKTSGLHCQNKRPRNRGSVFGEDRDISLLRRVQTGTSVSYQMGTWFYPCISGELAEMYRSGQPMDVSRSHPEHSGIATQTCSVYKTQCKVKAKPPTFS